MSYREEKLKSIRYQIGILSSEVLEDPETKLSNLLLLLSYMDERNPEVYITVRKIATASILEVFKDLLPSYHIWSLEKSEIKRKYMSCKPNSCIIFVNDLFYHKMLSCNILLFCSEERNVITPESRAFYTQILSTIFAKT